MATDKVTFSQVACDNELLDQILKNKMYFLVTNVTGDRCRNVCLRLAMSIFMVLETALRNDLNML